MAKTDFKKNTLLPLLSACFIAFGFSMGGTQLVLADIAREFNMQYTAMGSIVMIYFVATLSMPIVFGNLGDKYGKKKIIAIAFVFYIGGCLLATFSQNIAGLSVGMFVLGAGTSVIECTGAAALSDSNPEKAEKNINISESFYSGGAVISPLVVAAMMAAGANWRIVFIVSAVVFLALIPLLKITKFIIQEPEGGHKLKRQSFLSLFKSKILIIMFICMIVYVGVETGAAYFADSFFTAELGQPSFSAIAISFYWLAMTVSRVIFGIVKVNPQKFLKVSFGLSAAMLVPLALSNNAPLALAIFIIIGFLYGAIWPTLMALATKRFTASSGTVASIMMVGSGIGGAAFPVLIGLVADTVNLRWSMGLMVIFCFVAFLCCAVAFKNTKPAFASENDAG